MANINLSKQTLVLLKDLPPNLKSEIAIGGSSKVIEFTQLIELLTKLVEQQDDAVRKKNALIQAHLLADLASYLDKNKQNEQEESKLTGWKALKYIEFVGVHFIGGTVMNSCMGILAGIAFMELFFPLAPVYAMAIVCSVFAMLTLTVFWAFDLLIISQNVGITDPDNIYIDRLVKQSEALEAILNDKDTLLEDEKNDLNSLITQYIDELNKEIDKQKSSLKSAKYSYVRVLEAAVAVIVGMPVFADGLFIAFSVISAAAIGTISFSNPVLVAVALFAGLIMLCGYMRQQAPEVMKSVSRAFGYDEQQLTNLEVNAKKLQSARGASEVVQDSVKHSTDDDSSSTWSNATDKREGAPNESGLNQNTRVLSLTAQGLFSKNEPSNRAAIEKEQEAAFNQILATSPKPA